MTGDYRGCQLIFSVHFKAKSLQVLDQAFSGSIAVELVLVGLTTSFILALPGGGYGKLPAKCFDW
jgi:hypothetical protein